MKNVEVLQGLEFYFMRHAHAMTNARGEIPHPASCEGLSPLGRGQVLEAVAALKHLILPVGLVVTSPLLRACETAQPVAEALGLAIEVFPEFAEQDLGAWAGQPWKRIEPFFAERRDPPGGESNATFYARIREGLIKLRERPLSVVVTHGGVWHAIKALYGDFSTDWPPNGAIAHVGLGAEDIRLTPLFKPGATEYRTRLHDYSQ